MKCGLIGEKLGHSFSKQIHEEFNEYSYDLIEVEKSELRRSLLKSFDGLNVTIPYKEKVMPLLDKIDEDAKEIGAVNTVVNKNGVLYGYNTDILGMQYMIEKAGIALKDKFVAILGGGGTSKTAQRLCKNLSVKKLVVVRSSEGITYADKEQYLGAEVIINTTPVGMYPQNTKSIVDIGLFKNLEAIVDVVYNPLLTKICFEGKKRGIKVCNGLDMLVAQAKFARDLFKGDVADKNLIENGINSLRQSRENIILIGMAGCGKTTIGEILSKKLQKEFIDIDREIEKSTNMTIPQIFMEQGEEGFRKIETYVTADTCKNVGKVISTGGGVVTREENLFSLKQNGKVVLILRDLSKVDRRGRPLSLDEKRVRELFEKRRESYYSFSDIVVENNTIEQCVEEILRLLGE